MPQLNRGGKFIYGKSLLREDLTLQLPTQAVTEYSATIERKAYLFTSSKSTGGFCFTRRGLLEPSKLGHILTDNPTLRDYQMEEGKFLPYKGRSYCWIGVSEQGVLEFNQEMMEFLKLKVGMELLCIRSSNIAFTMGVKGPLIERADHYEGEIQVY